MRDINRIILDRRGGQAGLPTKPNTVHNMYFGDGRGAFIKDKMGR